MSLKLKPEVLRLIPYLVYLIILTVKPFEVIVPQEIYYSWEVNFSDIVLNALLFVPFGFLVFPLVNKASWKIWNKILMCCIMALTLSFLIETYQLFTLRTSQFSDIFTNTAGAFVGAALARYYYDKFFNIVFYVWSRLQTSKTFLTSIVALYSLTVLSITVLPVRYVDFRNWDPSHSFQLGNEATLDRPWVGKYYLVATYNRVLSDDEIYTNFKYGPYSNHNNRIEAGLVSLYDFREGSGKIVKDNSGVGSPLNLTISDTTKVKWLTPNGLEMLDSTIIKSEDPTSKLYAAVKSSNELTVEAWIAPRDANQNGPARIVSLSKDVHRRNFTIGQQEKNIHFRLRTPHTGLNGTNVNLVTETGFLTTEPQHLVVTYRDGIQTLFVNGIEDIRFTLYDKYYIKLLDSFGSNLLSKMAFCFFLFFPLSFICCTLFTNHCGENRKAPILTALFTFALLVVMELVYVALFPYNKNIDFGLLSLALLCGLLTVFFLKLVQNINTREQTKV